VAPLAPPETPGRGIENYILLRRKPPTAGHPSRISLSPRATTCEHRRDAFIIGRNRFSMHRGAVRPRFLDIDVAAPGRFRERSRAMRTPSEVHYIPERFEIPPDCWKLLFTLARFLPPPPPPPPPRPHPRFRDNAFRRANGNEPARALSLSLPLAATLRKITLRKKEASVNYLIVARRAWNRRVCPRSVLRLRKRHGSALYNLSGNATETFKAIVSHHHKGFQ